MVIKTVACSSRSLQRSMSQSMAFINFRSSSEKPCGSRGLLILGDLPICRQVIWACSDILLNCMCANTLTTYPNSLSLLTIKYIESIHVVKRVNKFKNISSSHCGLLKLLLVNVKNLLSRHIIRSRRFYKSFKLHINIDRVFPKA